MQYFSFLEFIKNISFFNVIEYSCIPDIIRNICHTISSTMKCNFDKKMSYILHLYSLQINFLILVGIGNILLYLFLFKLSSFSNNFNSLQDSLITISSSLATLGSNCPHNPYMWLRYVCPTISRPEIICASSLDIYTYALTWLSTLFKIEVWFFCEASSDQWESILWIICPSVCRSGYKCN